MPLQGAAEPPADSRGVQSDNFWDVQSDKVLSSLVLDSFGDRDRAQGVSKSCSCFTRVFVVNGKVTVQGIFFSLSCLLSVLGL